MHDTTRGSALFLLAAVLFVGAIPGSLAAEREEFCYSEPSCGPGSDIWPQECHTGTQQSPINLVSPYRPLEQQTTSMPTRRFIASSFSIQNNGHTLNINFTSNLQDTYTFPIVGLKSTPFRFSAGHFHWGRTNLCGSEHSINNLCYSMELHLVHYNANYPSLAAAVASNDRNALVVIGVLMTANARTSNLALAPIIRNIQQVRSPSSSYFTPTGTLDLTPLFPCLTARSDRTVYSYHGSLTTPGCNEQVHWFVFNNPASISVSDVMQFRTLLNHEGQPILENNRPVQKTNHRILETVNIIGAY